MDVKRQNLKAVLTAHVFLTLQFRNNCFKLNLYDKNNQQQTDKFQNVNPLWDLCDKRCMFLKFQQIIFTINM